MEVISTFNYKTDGERGCAVALVHTGVIALVLQADVGKLQVCPAILGGKLLTVLLPGQLEQRGARRWTKLQRAAQTIGRLLLPHKEHLLLYPVLIHAGLSYK